MKISYYNFDFKKDINLPYNINKINDHIRSVLKNLSSLSSITFGEEQLQKTIHLTKQFAKNKKNFIVFGIGGSNLGARALVNILQEKLNNKILFFDNIDPVSFQNSIIDIDFVSTGFLFISKSGTTSETLSHLGCMVELASIKNLLSKFYSNCLIITEFKESPLFNIGKENNCLLLEHNKDIGGRYSAFSNVGIVPALLAGLDVVAIHEGAKEVLKNQDYYQLFKLGQIFKFQNQKNFLLNVVMTYSDSLKFFGKWYLQLWAESIGKDKKGITAIHSVGATDQHSQLQLYLDGPEDKFFTFITTNHLNKGLKINRDIMKRQKLDYLIDKKMGDLMQAEQQATINIFNKKKIKFREIFIPKIDAYSIGCLMALCIVETVATCYYFEVDPFNQPAVEQGKLLTKKYLNN